MTSSHRCIAAGAWLLAAGLLVSSGGATAFADVGSDAAKGAGSSAAAKDHVASGSESRDAATTPGASQKAATRSDTDSDDPVTKPTTQITRNVTTEVGKRQLSADGESTAADTTPAADTAPAGDTSPPADTAPSPEASSPPPTTNEPQPSPTAVPTDDPSPTAETSTVLTTENALPLVPPDDGSTSGSDPGSSSSDPTPVSTAPSQVAQETSQASSSANDTAPTQDPVPPVPTVLAEALPTTTQAVAPPLSLPIDLALLLSTAFTVDPVVTDDEGNRRRAVDHDRPAMSPLQILQLLAQTPGASSAGEASPTPTLLDGSTRTRSGSAASAFGSAEAPAGTTLPSMAEGIQPDVALPEGLQTFLHTYGKVIVAVSLSAMLAAALPGLLGIVIPTAAGMHFGYRQAKAVRALRKSGIAHLAASGPIGVVRSGTLIALRSPRRRPLPQPELEGRSQEVA